MILGGPSVCWACGENPCEGWIECNPAPAPVPEAEALAQLAWSDAVIEEVNAGGLVLLISAEVPPTQPKPLDVADWACRNFLLANRAGRVPQGQKDTERGQ